MIIGNNCTLVSTTTCCTSIRKRFIIWRDGQIPKLRDPATPAPFHWTARSFKRALHVLFCCLNGGGGCGMRAFIQRALHFRQELYFPSCAHGPRSHGSIGSIQVHSLELDTSQGLNCSSWRVTRSTNHSPCFCVDAARCSFLPRPPPTEKIGAGLWPA